MKNTNPCNGEQRHRCGQDIWNGMPALSGKIRHEITLPRTSMQMYCSRRLQIFRIDCNGATSEVHLYKKVWTAD